MSSQYPEYLAFSTGRTVTLTPQHTFLFIEYQNPTADELIEFSEFLGRSLHKEGHKLYTIANLVIMRKNLPKEAILNMFPLVRYLNGFSSVEWSVFSNEELTELALERPHAASQLSVIPESMQIALASHKDPDVQMLLARREIMIHPTAHQLLLQSKSWKVKEQACQGFGIPEEMLAEVLQEIPGLSEVLLSTLEEAELTLEDQLAIFLYGTKNARVILASQPDLHDSVIGLLWELGIDEIDTRLPENKKRLPQHVFEAYLKDAILTKQPHFAEMLSQLDNEFPLDFEQAALSMSSVFVKSLAQRSHRTETLIAIARSKHSDAIDALIDRNNLPVQVLLALLYSSNNDVTYRTMITCLKKDTTNIIPESVLPLLVLHEDPDISKSAIREIARARTSRRGSEWQ